MAGNIPREEKGGFPQQQENAAIPRQQPFIPACSRRLGYYCECSHSRMCVPICLGQKEMRQWNDKKFIEITCPPYPNSMYGSSIVTEACLHGQNSKGTCIIQTKYTILFWATRSLLIRLLASPWLYHRGC